MKKWIILSVVLMVMGCSKDEARETASDVRDVITQENKVQDAHRAADQLNAIAAQRDDEMKELFGE